MADHETPTKSPVTESPGDTLTALPVEELALKPPPEPEVDAAFLAGVDGEVSAETPATPPVEQTAQADSAATSAAFLARAATEEEDEAADESGDAEDLQPESVSAAPAPEPRNRVIAALLSVKQFFIDFYEENFKSTPEGEADKRKIDTSNHGLHHDYRRRMGRAVNAVTSKPISSTKGAPTRRKKTAVQSRTYKPQLDRFKSD